jgi:hypothetical protein
VDPIVTKRLDPDAPLAEKRSGDNEPPPRRRRPASPSKPAAAKEGVEPTAHQIDDLA